MFLYFFFFFFSSRRRHTRSLRDWSSDVCSSDLAERASRKTGIVLAGASLVVAAVIPALLWNGRVSTPSESAAASLEMGNAGWITEWASDRTGSARGRQVSLYRPSLPMSDYTLEFLGQIERRSLGWVFRAADSRNYYVGKLELPDRAGPLTITRFAVVHGVEGPHFQRALASPTTSTLKVRLEARGPRFTIHLQNQVVEDWQDDRLRSGGVGFLTERDELASIGSIQISFPKGGIRQ